MFVWSIIAIVLVALIIAHCQEKKLADTLGLTCLGFVLVLYVLAMFRILTWIDYISVAVLFGGIFWIAENGLFRPILRKLFTAQNLCIFGVLFFLGLSQFLRTASSIEDISFWAIDAKSLLLNNGFALKAGNVAPQYGDYPPAVSLFKWFCLHMSQEYREGLGYAGFLCLNFILLLPIISRVDEMVSCRETKNKNADSMGVKIAKNKKYYVNDKKLISKYKVNVKNDVPTEQEQIDPLRAIILFFVNIIACIVLVLFPSITGTTYFEGSGAEVTMGIIFGFVLYYIWDKNDDHPIFFSLRVGIYGAVLILCRFAGFEWAIFAFFFMLLCFTYRKKGERYNQASFFDINIKCALAVVGSWIAVAVSWFLYVGLNKRVARPVSEGSVIWGEGQVGLLYRSSIKLPQFLKALVVVPMHTDRVFGIDLSAFAMILVLIIVVLVYNRRAVIDDKLRKYLLAYILGIAIICYGIIFIGHLTYWTFEFKYENVKNIAQSIAIYGSPFSTGFVILLIGILLNSIEQEQASFAVTESVVVEREHASHLKEMRIIYGVIALFVLLTCDYGGCYEGIVGYIDNREEVIQNKQQMIDDEAKSFVDTVARYDELHEKRILYVRDAADVKRENEPYISYEIVPTAVVYGAVTEATSGDDIDKMIYSSQAQYIYIDDVEGVDAVFAPRCEGEYTSKTIYKISPEGKLLEFFETIEE